jgi:plasmid stabilization system protein ParE
MIYYKPQANRDIEQVIDYIEYELFNPIAAERFAKGITAKIDSLEFNAGIFAISTYRDVLKYNPTARHVTYKGFAIIYSIHGNLVVVHRVIHGSLIKA